MFDDPWPEEPADPYGDPDDPATRAERDLPASDDASRALYRAFWGLVVVFNVGLAATALGALLLAFRGDVLVGGGLLAVGLLALVYGVRRYRAHRATGFAFERPGDDEGA